MLALRRFVTVHGHPAKIISDHGSQLMAAAKEMKGTMHVWKWYRISRFGKEKGDRSNMGIHKVSGGTMAEWVM